MEVSLRFVRTVVIRQINKKIRRILQAWKIASQEQKREVGGWACGMSPSI